MGRLDVWIDGATPVGTVEVAEEEEREVVAAEDEEEG